MPSVSSDHFQRGCRRSYMGSCCAFMARITVAEWATRAALPAFLPARCAGRRMRRAGFGVRPSPRRGERRPNHASRRRISVNRHRVECGAQPQVQRVSAGPPSFRTRRQYLLPSGHAVNGLANFSRRLHEHEARPRSRQGCCHQQVWVRHSRTNPNPEPVFRIAEESSLCSTLSVAKQGQAAGGAAKHQQLVCVDLHHHCCCMHHYFSISCMQGHADHGQTLEHCKSILVALETFPRKRALASLVASSYSS